jgi:hypothetical protein
MIWNRKLFWLIPTAIALYLTALVVPFLLQDLPEGNWRGYLQFSVDENLAAEVEEVLKTSGHEVVSRRTTMVRFNTFMGNEGSEEIPLSAIGERFDPLDPRLDPYIINLDRYFSLPGKEILYLRDGEIAWKLKKELGEYWGKISFQGSNFSLKIFGVIILLLSAGILFLRFHRGISSGRVTLMTPMIFITLITVVPWMFLVIQGNPHTAIGASALFILGYLAHFEIDPKMEYFFSTGVWKGPLAKGKIIFFVLGVFIIVGTAFRTGWETGISFLLAFSAAFSVSILRWTWRYRKHRRFEHNLFYYMPIVDQKYRIQNFWHIPAIISVWLLSLTFTGVYHNNQHTSQPMPTPVAVDGLINFTWDSLFLLSTQEGENYLPDLSAYLAHRAFQESLPYNRSWSFPFPGEQVTVSRYKRIEGKIQKTEEVRKEFTASWYEDIIANTQGIMHILLSQQRPVRVMITSNSAVGPVSVRYVLIFCAAIIPFCLPWKNRRKPIMNGKKGVTLRKKRQAA